MNYLNYLYSSKLQYLVEEFSCFSTINSGYSNYQYALISPKIKDAILTVNKFTNCCEILLSV